jgi:hypothetical protein
MRNPGVLAIADKVGRITMLFVAVHESVHGTSRRFAATQRFGRFGSAADI